jgi:hypothetical protein
MRSMCYTRDGTALANHTSQGVHTCAQGNGGA